MTTMIIQGELGDDDDDQGDTILCTIRQRIQRVKNKVEVYARMMV